MGGSGGRGMLGGSKPEELREKLRRAEAEAKSDQFEVQVGGLISEILAEYNSRDIEGLKEILEKVQSELEEELEGTVELLFGGSVARHTYVDGLSDIDALVLLKPMDVANNSPAALRSAFAERLRTRFGVDAVYEGTLAVTLTIGDKTIQLLPALREGDGFKIASSDGRRWARISPKNFAETLTGANQALDGKLIPVIKLAKGIIGSLPEQRQLTGYHTEALAIMIFRDYDLQQTSKAMVQNFFEKAPDMIRKRISDPTHQSEHIDDYLGTPGSVQRGVIADALSRIARRIRNANGAQSINAWRDLISSG